MMHKMYTTLASWWHLLSPPDEYREEADFFLDLLDDIIASPPVTLLELGSGGGNNALYLKKSFATVTLVDLSRSMLDASQRINPDCQHLEGDMRTVRLDRTFDVVFIHDAIDYMTTHDDLRQAMTTAFLHCRPGGVCLIVPDHVRETFEGSTDHGGADDDKGGVRYLEWSYDSDPTDTLTATDYVILVRQGDHVVALEHDHHTLGLFGLDEWLSLLNQVGFTAEYVVDAYERYVFIAHKPASTP